MVKHQKKIEQIAGMALLGAIVVGCMVVLRPFVSAILWAAILCFATWPVHEFLLRWLRRRRNLAAGLMTVLLSLVLLIPFLVAALTFSDSIGSGVKWLESHSQAPLPPPPAWVAKVPLAGERLSESWSRLATEAEPAVTRLQPWFKEAGLWLLRHSLDFAQGIFQMAMSLLIAFFLYRDGEGIVARLREGFNRLSGDYAQHLMETVKTTVRGVVYGVIGAGLAQGIVAWIGFTIVGVPSPLLLGLLTFFMSLLPFGPPIVWISASIWLLAQGRIGWTIFMVIYGILGISGIDNVVKPYVISREAKLPFIVMLIGVLGGVLTFGFIGIFLGPTLLAVGFGLAQEILGQRRAGVPERADVSAGLASANRPTAKPAADSRLTAADPPNPSAHQEPPDSARKPSTPADKG